MIEAESRLVNEQRDFGEREVIRTSLHVARDWRTHPLPRGGTDLIASQ